MNTDKTMLNRPKRTFIICVYLSSSVANCSFTILPTNVRQALSSYDTGSTRQNKAFKYSVSGIAGCTG